MESGREAGCGDGGALGVGFLKIVEMKVPKRWFLRKSEGPGPEQSIVAELGYRKRSDSYTHAVFVWVAGRH